MDNVNDAIAENVRLVYKQLSKLNLLNDQDAESIGYEALHSAIITYDASQGSKLSTYASVCIYNALGSYLRTKCKQRQLEVLSYNNVAYATQDGEQTWEDFMASPETVEDSLEHKAVLVALVEYFDEAVTLLTNPTHRRIVLAWRESDFSATTKELAKIVGVSQPYVSQVINIFKHKLKKKMEENDYGT